MTSSSDSFAIRGISNAQAKLKDSFAKLSSGLRITKASDDAAGLAIAESLKNDAVTLSQGARNAQDGISLSDIRDGALQQLGEIGTRLQELSSQSANGTLSDTQRQSLSTEFNALTEEAGRIAQTTNFNGQNVFSSSEIQIQVGADSSANSQVGAGTADISSLISSIQGLDISTQASALSALDSTRAFNSSVSETRGRSGASVVRLETAIKNNEVASENLRAADSRIRDVDVASESANLVRNQILTQTSSAVAAHGKLNAQTVLNLLK